MGLGGTAHSATRRLLTAGLPARWVAFDEVYGRSEKLREKLREKAAKAGLAYVAIIPCDYQVTLPSGAQNGKGRARLGPVPGPHLGRDLPDTALAALAQLRTAAIRSALTGARLAFALRWSARRRRHQATARWHHYSARLLAVTRTG